MARAVLLLVVVLINVTLGAAYAADWELDLNTRLLTSDAGKSLAQGGFSAVRFDEGQSGVQLGRARFALSEHFGELWALHLDASAYGEGTQNPAGFTEAFLQLRPYPRGGYRFRLKAGAFHAPISLENRAAGWDSPYTVSYSALNSWLGEELRTIGLEGQLEWLGTRSGHSVDLGMTGGVFGWNDLAGAVLAYRGFSFTDRQTFLFDRVGRSDPDQPKMEPFHELDGRPGYYGGVEARYLDRIVVQALHYDNRADLTASDPAARLRAWRTTFNSAGIRAETDNGWTVIVQWLDGDTYVAPGGLELEWPFNARFALLSKRVGRQMLSVRYDDFEVESRNTEDDGTQKGHAWTAAYVLTPNDHWRLGLEWLRVVSYASNREDYLGTSGLARETQIQLAVRYSIGSAIR